jgi:hypothetical protein
MRRAWVGPAGGGRPDRSQRGVGASLRALGRGLQHLVLSLGLVLACGAPARPQQASTAGSTGVGEHRHPIPAPAPAGGRQQPVMAPDGGDAVPRPRFPYGIVSFDLNPPVLAALSDLGVGLVRGSCDWKDLEPLPGVFDWTCSDKVILNARAQHLRSYVTVSCTPAWANAAAGCDVLPANLGDWRALVANFTSRYMRFDTILGVWNEPNLGPRPIDPAGYADLFLAASTARNSVNVGFVLAGPETSHHALRSGYFQAVMQRIRSDAAMQPQDVVAVHWYPDGPPVLGYLDAVHLEAGSHEVWLSETGMATPDLGTQAAFYDSLLKTFIESGRTWWTHIVFYRLWDNLDCCSEAILTAGFEPKPAFQAYRSWIAKPVAVPRPAGSRPSQP